jgi:hypothetical protein
VFGPNESMTKTTAFESWKAWAEAANEFVGTKGRLIDRIARLPRVDEARVGKDRDRSFVGIGLRPEGLDG